MRNLYSMCILSVLSVGYVHDVKAYPIGVQCGIAGHGRRKPRIVNGTVAEDRQFPWITSIKRNGSHICGGSIISERYVLSAAHCFDEYDELDRDNWSITLGDFSQLENESFSVNYGIKQVIIHQEYDTTGKVVLNDIVLLELSNDIQWTDHIQPICLPVENVLKSSTAIAAGWGPDNMYFVYSHSAQDNDKLRYVEIEIYENNDCNEMYEERHLDISLDKTLMCAGASNRNDNDIRDTNHGDSGGPLLVKVDGRQILVGITSTGAGPKESIYPQPPGIYTRVFEYMGWIIEHVHEGLYYPPVLTNKLE